MGLCMISVLVASQRGAVVALHALLALRPSDSRQHTHVYYLSTCVVSPLYRSFAMMNDMHLGLASVRPPAQRRVCTATVAWVVRAALMLAVLLLLGFLTPGWAALAHGGTGMS